MKSNIGLIQIFQERGASLVSVLVGVAVSTIVVLGIGVVFVRSAEMNQSTHIKVAQDQMHQLGLHMARSPEMIKKQVITANPAIQKCLESKGTQCDKMASNQWQVVPPSTAYETHVFYNEQMNQTATKDSNSVMERTVQYRMNCPSSAKCVGVDVRVVTQRLDHSGYMKDDIHSYAARQVVGQAKIDLNCTTLNGWITLIDYSKTGGNGSCTSQPLDVATDQISACSQGSQTIPKRGFGRSVAAQDTCVQVAKDTCGTGFSGAGNLSGQSTCFSGTIPDPTLTPCTPVQTSCQADGTKVSIDACGKMVDQVANDPACASGNLNSSQCDVNGNRVTKDISGKVISSVKDSTCATCGSETKTCQGKVAVFTSQCGERKVAEGDPECDPAVVINNDCQPATVVINGSGNQCPVDLPIGHDGEKFWGACRYHEWDNQNAFGQISCVQGSWTIGNQYFEGDKHGDPYELISDKCVVGPLRRYNNEPHSGFIGVSCMEISRPASDTTPLDGSGGL